MRNSTQPPATRFHHLTWAAPLCLVVAVLAFWMANGPRPQKDSTISEQGERPKIDTAATNQKSFFPIKDESVNEAFLPALEADGPSFKLLEELTQPIIAEKLPEDPTEPVPPGVFQVTRSVEIDQPSLTALRDLREGARIGFPIPKGGFLNGSVRLRASEDGALQLAGSLDHGTGSQFTLTFRDQSVSGMILDPARGQAYVVAVHPQNGRPILQEKPIQSVKCEGIPKPPGDGPDRMSRSDGPWANVTVPLLESLPGATEVIYLDFDGEVVTDPLWASGSTIIAEPAEINGTPISQAQINQVWQYVSEDFRPFRVNVTTNVARYNNAQVGRRMRCIITPTSDAGPGTGGVAYRDSFSEAGTGFFSANIPCWAFVDGSTIHQALVISHEIGHTLGLAHQGLAAWTDPVDQRTLPYQEYYAGHGTGPASWGPIMGNPYFRNFTQWSRGEFFRAYRGPTAAVSLRQDDTALIGRAANHFGLKTDDVGGTTGTSRLVSGNLLGNINDSGLIHTNGDADFFRFNSAGGALNVTATPIPAAPNLKIRLQLRDADDNIVAESNPPNNVTASISRNLTVGTWYLVVLSGETGTPLENPPTGFTTHGSLGDYTLTGNFPPLPALPLITSEPSSATVDEGKPFTLTVGAISNSLLRYQWFRILPGGVERPVAGATSASYRIAKASATHIGTYKARLTNNTGVTWSEEVQVEVRLRAKITTQPPNITLDSGAPFSFAPPHVGEPPLIYQWFRNGKVMVGEIGPALEGVSADWDTGALYRLEITNFLGKAVSRSFRVTINSPPIFVDVPPLFAVPALGSAVLAPKVVGTPRLQYQWLKDSVELPGATKPSLRLAGQPPTLGQYSLRVSNQFDSVTSNPIEVVIDERLRITEHPLAGQFTRGDRIVLNVETTGDDPLTYQWQRNRIDIAGATSKTLEMDPSDWFSNGRYRVVVSNRVSRVTSREAVVRVTSRPEITLHPQSTKGARTRSIALTARAEGTAKLSYQWLKDGVEIVGATRNRLVLTKLDTQHEGDYVLRASNDLGTMDSNPATLIVEDAPSITLHPQPGFIVINTNITATVVASGSPDLRYQWQRNNRDIPGQVAPELNIPGDTLQQSGRFRVIVTNDVGRVVSKAAALTVQIPPTISVQPRPQTNFEGERVDFTVTAAGSKTLKYRWLHNGVPVSSARTLILRDPRMNAAGTYVVEVSNNVGTATSDPVEYDILPVPVPSIIQLIPQVARPGHRIALRGQQLKYARKVTVRGVSIPFTKTVTGEVIATIPTTLTAGGVVRLESLGGAVNAPSNLTISKTVTNDDFENSFVVLGANVSSTIDNLEFTSQSGEPNATRLNSAWWRWNAPRTGRFQITTLNSAYDTVLGVYQRGFSTTINQPEVRNDLTLLAYNDDVDFARHSRVVIDAVAGAPYRIAVGAWSTISFGGYTQLTISPEPSSAPLASRFEDDSAITATVEVASATYDPLPETVLQAATITDSVTLGGAMDSEATFVMWKPEAPAEIESAQIVTASASILLLPPDTESTDSFSLTFYNSAEIPVLSIHVSAANGSLRVINAAGDEWLLDGQIHRFSPVQLEVSINNSNQTWSVTLDGVTLESEQPLGNSQGTLPNILDLVFDWHHEEGSAPASLQTDNLQIMTSPAL